MVMLPLFIPQCEYRDWPEVLGIPIQSQLRRLHIKYKSRVNGLLLLLTANDEAIKSPRVINQRPSDGCQGGWSRSPVDEKGRPYFIMDMYLNVYLLGVLLFRRVMCISQFKIHVGPHIPNGSCSCPVSRSPSQSVSDRDCISNIAVVFQ